MKILNQTSCVMAITKPERLEDGIEILNSLWKYSKPFSAVIIKTTSIKGPRRYMAII